eukprot:493428-Pyramimonas_sp.AAC.1
MWTNLLLAPSTRQTRRTPRGDFLDLLQRLGHAELSGVKLGKVEPEQQEPQVDMLLHLLPHRQSTTASE